MFNYIKMYFVMGLYTIDQLKTFVVAQMITADQFKEIAGIEYAAE